MSYRSYTSYRSNILRSRLFAANCRLSTVGCRLLTIFVMDFSAISADTQITGDI